MFRTLQWAYNLGVRQERQRIKIAIHKIRVEIASQSELHQFDIRDNKMAERQRKDLQQKLNNNYKINAVLNKLTSPSGEWVSQAGAPIDGSK